MSVLAAITVLAILILVHELGHFLAARSQGIYVNRFSLGFGPILWKYQGSQTEYAVRAFPLGGFVGFPDDDPDSEIPVDDPNLLRNRPVLDRAIVISAGVVANLIFAYFVLVLLFGIVGIPDLKYSPGVLVKPGDTEQSVAYQAGIRKGDIILAVQGKELEASKNAVISLKTEIENSPNQPVELKIQRQQENLSIQVTPELKNGKGHVGIALIENATPIYHRPRNIQEIFGTAANKFQQLVVGTFQGFGQLITNFQNTADKLAGPVKIVEAGAKLAANDSTNLLFFAAIISINLAVINILPLPALDGGQLAFLLIEGLRGKPLPNKIQENVMQTGLVLLLGLGIFLIVKDTSQLEWVQKLFQ